MPINRRPRTIVTVVVAAAAVATGAATPAPAAGHQATPAGAVPVSGGTLRVVSSSDTDYLDPNITYFSLGYSYIREISRQLYTQPAVAGRQTHTVPDLATRMPRVSDDGRTYRITIRRGALWDTSPPRQVTAADLVRGVEVTCNPAQPFGGLPDYLKLIAGLRSFCRGFARVSPTARAIRHYVRTHSITGVHASRHDPRTVVFRLRYRAAYFTDMLTLPAFSPRPVEAMRYVPASVLAAEHIVSDGPYRVKAYQPTRKIVYVRSPAWNPATDPVRHAYPDTIVVDMTVNDLHRQLVRMRRGTADVAMQGLETYDAMKRRAAGDEKLGIESSISSNPYLLFNTVSPNNNGALRDVKVRRALSYAINRGHLIRATGGTWLNEPLRQVLPPEIIGHEPFNRYPHSRAKATSMLAAAGASNLTLTFLYRPASPTSSKMFAVVKDDLSKVGVTVKGKRSSDADFYSRYLMRPSSARHGQWDLTLSGWGPDWYGNAALSFFRPLFDGRVLPPASYNFGLFNSPRVNGLIDRATKASRAHAARAWHRVDVAVMGRAAFFPIDDPREATYHAKRVHGFVYMPPFQTADFTNLWLR